jgi:oligopeptide transport system substrate-binding protein
MFLLAMVGSVLLPACNRPEAESIVVTEVVVVEGREQVVTRLVRQIVEVTATARPAPVIVEPVELDVGFVGSAPNIDPQKSDSANGIDLIENLFVGLTNYNHSSNSIEPELAQTWEVSRDGRTWTFHLRDDIFWVRPAATTVGESRLQDVEPVRQVTAADVVYAMQRVCHRETGTPDAFILFLIEGCEQVNGAVEATEVDLDRIGVRALDDFTLQVSLTKPASYFLTMTSMWFFHPVPQERIEEFGDEWQMSENLVTSGPFFPLPRATAARTVLHRNPLWPIPGQGNVDIVNIAYLDDETSVMGLWQDKGLDVSLLPAAERDDFISQTPQRASLVTDQTVFYLGFNFDSGVFREPQVRRAFAAAIDRERLVEEIYSGLALEMRHLLPPGILAAPPIDQVGTGYSPDYARQQMEESGFRSCRLMPPVTFLITSSDLSLRQAELARQMWIEELGCSEEQFIIEQVQFGTLLANTRREAGAARPDIWELGWSSYYPDAHNWAGSLIHCEDSENRQNRPCTEVDDLIREAASTVDLEQRRALYRQVENLLFGDDGITPLIPLYVRGDYVLVQAWLDYRPALFGGEQYDTYVIDTVLKDLERSR